MAWWLCLVWAEKCFKRVFGEVCFECGNGGRESVDI